MVIRAWETCGCWFTASLETINKINIPQAFLFVEMWVLLLLTPFYNWKQIQRC